MDEGARQHPSRQQRARYSQSLERGLAVLSCFTPQTPSLGVAEVAASLEMSRATAHRYLQALAKLGYLEQDASRKYRLDLGVTDLGLAAWNAMGLPEHARPQIARLARRTGHAVELAVLDGCETVVVDRASPRVGGGTGDRHGGSETLGHRAPAHCTSAGKAILAFLPVDARERLLSRLELAPLASKSITDREALAAELEHVRLESLAISEHELAEGLFGIAAPIRGRDGEPLGAIALENRQAASAVASDGASHLLEHFGGLLIGSAALVSRRLGWAGTD